MSADPEVPPPSRPPTDPLAGLNLKGAFEAALEEDQWEPPHPDELAAVLPDYQITCILGRGGMGAIYKARDPELDRLVAIKLLPPELCARPDLVERFSREARALAKLDHPNIVRIFDFGRTTGNHLYFVMEYVDGLDLGRILRIQDGHSLPHDHGATFEIISQICSALQYAHNKGIIHRDIKPANVLLSKEGHVKVADFGLARAIDPAEGNSGFRDAGAVTLSGIVMGTLEYMSPEQQEGRRVDHRSDLYSTGVLFYQMLTGHLPRGAFHPPSRRTTRIDARLDRVVMKALQSEPVERYQQAHDLQEAVQALIKLRTPAATRPGRNAHPEPPELHAPGSSWGWKRWSSLAAGAALAGVAIYAIPQRLHRSGSPSRFPDKLTLREALPASQTVTDGIYEVTLPPSRELELSRFYTVPGEPLQLSFSAPGYQSQTLTLMPGQLPPAVRLEPVLASISWSSAPPGWFSAARLTRIGAPEDHRLETSLDIAPGGRRLPAGKYATGGVWGSVIVPLQPCTVSGDGEIQLKWPHPQSLAWTGVADLNPQPVLQGITAPFQQASAAWSVPVAVPCFLDFRPGGEARLRILNPQLMQLALLAIMGGSLPDADWEKPEAVSAAFQRFVLNPLGSRNTSPTRLGQWFSTLWKEQSSTPLARSGDVRRSAGFLQFRDHAAFLSALLTSPDPASIAADPRFRQIHPLYFDDILLQAAPSPASGLSLTSRDGSLELSTRWDGTEAELRPKGKPPVALKIR